MVARRFEILFVLRQRDHNEIAVMTPNGENITSLIKIPVGCCTRRGRPTGSKISFQTVGTDHIVLEVINADGTHRMQVADHRIVDPEVGQGASWI